MGGDKTRKLEYLAADAIKMVASLEGMFTDPVYEGKSIAALIDLVKEGYFKPGGKVLYAHLGCQPAVNAYTTALRGKEKSATLPSPFFG